MLRGVNLGGWLVLERWITPSIFYGLPAIDEYSLSQLPEAAALITEFRDSFITEADFAWLAEQGVQLLRLPVGYWIFGSASPYQATVDYVDKAFEWAAKHDLQILLDLHGAPGSQNGNDHSGCVGPVGWCDSGHSYGAQTLNVLARICQRYGQSPQLWGIELLNEPSPQIPPKELRQFYRRGYHLVTTGCAPHVKVVAHDAFRPWRWPLHFPLVKYSRLVIDHHHYQLFTDKDRNLTPWQQIRRTRRWLYLQLALPRLTHNTMIGEWSAALPAVQMDLVAVLERESILKAYGAAQLRAFRGQQAECFWTYKTEGSTTWDYRALHELGLLERQPKAG